MTTHMDIVQQRLESQHLSTAHFATPGEVVSGLVAVQAQDYTGAKWALGLRLQRATDAGIEQALAEGSILRTHVMRPTWHFVCADDIVWLLALTGPRVQRLTGQQLRAVHGLDDAAIELLPWGRDTKVADLKIENATVREALGRVLSALGLMVEERGGDLMVVATQPLARINRRATWEDLKLLRMCNETEFSQDAFSKLKFQYRISSKVDAPGLLAAQLAKAGQRLAAIMIVTFGP